MINYEIATYLYEFYTFFVKSIDNGKKLH